MTALLLIVTALLAGVVAWLFLRARRVQTECESLTGDNAKLKDDLARALGRVHTLAKYESLPSLDDYVAAQHAAAKLAIDEADRHAAARRGEAESMVKAAEQRSANLVASARAAAEAEAAQQRAIAQKWVDNLHRQADAMMAEAKATADVRVREAEQRLLESQAKAAAITDEASRRAQEIAGDALTAMKNAKQYEETARAMKNVIEGYGDQYLVPTFTILDELGEEFGFTQAGQSYKAARERVRELIRVGRAATCEYVEHNRRETAIHFVLDAFNGKCDSVLADVRHDNYGTLAQKIKDAFSLVNKNGQAFRNACIEPGFLQARLEELRWAVAVQELKLKERDEQRAIKERIREEERAQREYEKAMKDAAKEEETIRKAMEKARREIEKASEEQKAKYEQQLAELTDKLRAAEEKNQRALSMAQQTKAGHVYVISNVGSFGEHVYKIGLTRRLEPLERIRELGDASVPFEFDVHALIRSEDAPALERELQKRFIRHQVNKVNPRKEFFRVPIAEIRRVAEAIGCQAAWTMTAESREYRETTAIEKSMESHTFEEAAWIERQLKESDAMLHEPANDVTELAS